MKSSDQPTSKGHYLIPKHYADTPLRFRRRSYEKFDRWMDRQLRRMVKRWAHLGNPWRRGRRPR